MTMSGMSLGLFVEILVAVLLLVTIAYCVIVHGKLKWLKSDQAKLIKVIGELNTATANAEHAIAALCTLSGGAEKTLESQIERTRALTAELASGVAEAEHFLSKINRVLQASETKPQPVKSAPAPAAAPIVRPAVRARDVGLGQLNAMRRSGQAARRIDQEVA